MSMETAIAPAQAQLINPNRELNHGQPSSKVGFNTVGMGNHQTNPVANNIVPFAVHGALTHKWQDISLKDLKNRGLFTNKEQKVAGKKVNINTFKSPSNKGEEFSIIPELGAN